MRKSEIKRCLSDLAIHRNVAASTPNQAMNALVFLSKEILDRPRDEHLAPITSKKPTRFPRG
ncbi:MAG: hypothetical protein HY731_05625 [Candidatus Tectomicrobia bacterium]|nr:hypothetical protein [Candidatus Tectomicrobia bacterium]